MILNGHATLNFGGFLSVVKDFHFAFKTKTETMKAFPSPIHSPFFLSASPRHKPTAAVPTCLRAGSASCSVFPSPFALLWWSQQESPCGSPGKVCALELLPSEHPCAYICVSHCSGSLPCCFCQSFGRDRLILWGPAL